MASGRQPIVRIDVGEDKTARTLTSPDGSVVLGFSAGTEGLSWTISRKGKTLVERSPLGLVLADTMMGRAGAFRQTLARGLRVVAEEMRSCDGVWNRGEGPYRSFGYFSR